MNLQHLQHIEAAYRRGYHQAAAEAFQAAANGADVEDLAEWAARVSAWQVDLDEANTPPRPRPRARRAE